MKSSLIVVLVAVIAGVLYYALSQKSHRVHPPHVIPVPPYHPHGYHPPHVVPPPYHPPIRPPPHIVPPPHHMMSM